MTAKPWATAEHDERHAAFLHKMHLCLIVIALGLAIGLIALPAGHALLRVALGVAALISVITSVRAERDAERFAWRARFSRRVRAFQP